MHLDMRNQIVIGENGKKGLRDVMGIVLIDPQFDDIPEFYTCFEQTTLVPVVLANRYYLYDTKNRKTLTKGYDRIFRYFGAYINYFVAVENGKKSILDASSGHELTPIIMDEVYEMQDEDGAIPMLSDGKAAFLWGETYTGPIFERALIFSECFTEVMYNGEWGWIDCDGKFTKEKSKASFGSWYDLDK